jgi:hypothetical protein
MTRWLVASWYAFSVLGCALRQEGARSYPAYNVEGRQAEQAGCAKIEAWGKRSVKTGAGFVVALSAAGPAPCPVVVRAATLEIAGSRHDARSLPRSEFSLAPESRVFVYVPFAYDAQAAWNDGERRARLELLLDVASQRNLRVSWSFRHELPERSDGE